MPAQQVLDEELAIELCMQEVQEQAEMRKQQDALSLQFIQSLQEETTSTQCNQCLQNFELKQVLFLNACDHQFCQLCIRHHVMQAKQDLHQLSCLSCTAPLHLSIFKVLLLQV